MTRSLLFIGDSAFGAVLTLLPDWLRDRFAEDMRETFQERQRHAVSTGGIRHLLSVTTRELGGLIRLAAQSRMRGQALLSLGTKGGGSSSTTESPAAPPRVRFHP